ncbi:hypothetical protein HN865_01555 [Candidatus Woesearchaeota archaeon]|jgi:hypothetical protein|nr:hypothetical protein [Candidatus Woesearchaeota archaeon]
MPKFKKYICLKCKNEAIHVIFSKEYKDEVLGGTMEFFHCFYCETEVQNE